VTWLGSAWLLPCWAAVLYLIGGSDPESPWRSRVDLALAIASGLVFAWLTAVRLPPYHLALWPLTASDFFQYCESVGAVVRHQPEAFWDQRSWFAAQLPAALATRWGVLGGLALGAVVSQVLLGASLYLWGRAVHGRFAGLASVLLGAAVAPLVVLARTVTFYPESVAVCALSAATAALAARFRTVPALLAAGTSAGLALLVDVRGLYWALAGLGVAGLAALVATARRVPLRLAALLLPVVASWWVAWRFVDPVAPGLTRQTAHFVRDVIDHLHLAVVLDEPPGRDFLWGRSSPAEIPAALADAAFLAGQLPPEASADPEVVASRATHVDPWRGPALGAALLALAGVARRPWRLLALLGPLVPYLVSLRTAALVLTHPRYLAVASAGLPVVLGVAAAVVTTRSGRGLPTRLRVPLATALVAALVLGVVPSWLSPVAPWRIPQAAEQFPRDLQEGRRVPNATDRVCAALLAEDAAAGRTWEGYPPPP
jgi:hypothetical protein